MSDDEHDGKAGSAPASAEPADSRIFSPYGIGSLALGLLSVAAIALGSLIWSAHHDQVDERAYQSQVLRAAAEWTSVLINMNTDNVDASLRQLHQDTVGQLNAEFDSAVQPYRQVIQKLKSHSAGQVEAVAIESVHQQSEPGSPPRQSEPLPAEIASRVDTVLVVATSAAENVSGKQQMVHWNLRLDVADVAGTPRISALESIR
jgi:hypothetical protein